jgi:glycosyltransferase involved in cell wall biosynthesis
MARRFHEWLPQQRIVTSQNFTTTAQRTIPLPKIPTFLWMGRMMPEKRILDFCTAIDLVPRHTSRPFQVIIVGNGHHLDTVKAWANDKTFVTVTGSVTHEETDKYIDASSALVMTSQGFDNQPMVIAESIVAGRGVVSVDPDLLLDIDPEAGLYPADSSPEGLAQLLADLVDSPDMLQGMSVAAIRCADIFSAAAGYERLLGVYEEAIRTSHSSTIVSSKP